MFAFANAACLANRAGGVPAALFFVILLPLVYNGVGGTISSEHPGLPSGTVGFVLLAYATSIRNFHPYFPGGVAQLRARIETRGRSGYSRYCRVGLVCRQGLLRRRIIFAAIATAIAVVVVLLRTL